MREVVAAGGEALQILDRLTAPVVVGGAQRRPDNRLEQGGFAVGGGAKHLQVSPLDAEAGKLRARLDDLRVGVVVEQARGEEALACLRDAFKLV